MPRQLLITFRPATIADLDFLDNLHAVCLKAHVVKAYPWKPELFRQTFDPEIVRVILADDLAIGMLQVSESQHELYLGNILISPDYQNRGIGTAVIRKVLQRAETLGLPVRLQVLKQNRAINLYRRLGFRLVGVTRAHYVMTGGD